MKIPRSCICMGSPKQECPRWGKSCPILLLTNLRPWNFGPTSVRASIYLHDTMSHAVAWISSCGCMLSIHVFACGIVMYSLDCGHLSTWCHASTWHVACNWNTLSQWTFCQSIKGIHKIDNFPKQWHFLVSAWHWLPCDDIDALTVHIACE